MRRTSPIRRTSGFTFAELLVALALGALVAAILAALVHGLLVAKTGQSSRHRGPFAARAALRTLSREIASAFAPPDENLVPLRLSTSTEPDKPDVRLDFYAPVPAEPRSIGGYDVHQIAYEVMRVDGGLRELRRIAAPCSGPDAPAPVTNRLFVGRFRLAVSALTNANPLAEWPPADLQPPTLPTSIRLSLAVDGDDPVETEVLIQSAVGIRSPVERREAADNEEK